MNYSILGMYNRGSSRSSWFSKQEFITMNAIGDKKI